MMRWESRAYISNKSVIPTYSVSWEKKSELTCEKVNMIHET